DTGGLRLAHPLDFDLSPGTAVGGDPALVYNSDTVSVRPIISAFIASGPDDPVPLDIQARLKWDDRPWQDWVTFSTSGHGPGDVYLLGLQVTKPVEATGRYAWQFEVRADMPGQDPIELSLSGYSRTVVNDASPFGAGWWLNNLDYLVPVTDGILHVQGNGD